MSKQGRIFSEIWTDKPFLALTANAQRMYFLLLSQPDIETNGVIPLRERRWAKTASDIDLQTVWNDLKELHDARFLLIDEEAGELFIRSYMRRDEVYLQPYPMVSAGRALRTVTSELILRAIAIEIDRIALENTDLIRLEKGFKPLTEKQKWGIGSFLTSFRSVSPTIYSTISPLTWEDAGNTDPSTKGLTKGSPKGLPKGLPKGRGARGKERSYVTDRRTQASRREDAPDALFPEPNDEDRSPVRRGPMPRKAFQAIYDRWPRKGSPDPSLKAFDQILRKERIPQAQLETACENYIRSMTGNQFAKQMNTFLREGDWRDWIIRAPETPAAPPDRRRCPDHESYFADNCPHH